MSRNFSTPSCVDQTTLLMLEDEVLPPEEMAAVYAHLDGCRACQMLARELAGWRRTALAFAGQRAPGSCPEFAALGAYAEGKLATDERQSVTTHLSACGRCTADLAALVSELAGVEAEAEVQVPAELLARARALVPAHSPAPALAARSDRTDLNWFDRLVIAFRSSAFPMAATAAVALILLVQIPKPNEVVSTVRIGQNAAVGIPRIVLGTPAEGGDMRASQRILSWEALQGTDTYQVTLVDETGGMVWTGETAQPWIECPAAVPLVPGARYAWWVTSGLESGDRARSSVQRFTYEP